MLAVTSEPVQPLPPSHDEQLRGRREGQPHPEYPPDHPRERPAGEPSSHQVAAQALDRRIEREKAQYERGFPVAGHDFAREAREREDRGREH